MKQEYKIKAQTFLESANMRLERIEGMLNGTYPVSQTDAKLFMKEIKKHLKNLDEIISIS